MNRRRWSLLNGVLGVGLVLATGSAVQAQGPMTNPHISAQAAILVNPRNGTILYEKDAFRQMDPASLTKMMTAIVILKAGHLSREVRISAKAAYVEGSKLHIRPGQRYSELDLLRGLLVRSGNDAAIALAEAHSGSVDRFAIKMNQAAQQLGAWNTRFQNPNGLTEPGHYSDAYDLALIARKAMRFPVFRHIVASKQHDVVERTSGTTRTIRTTNRLLYEYPGANGIKTGTTSAAGKCLVASASRDGSSLLAVVLKSDDRWQDARTLLNWGFSHWENCQIYHRGQVVADASVIGGREAWVPLIARSSLEVTMPKGARVRVVEQFSRRLKAPVAKGPIGYVYVVAGEEPPVRVAVGPEHAVPVQRRFPRFWNASLGIL